MNSIHSNLSSKGEKYSSPGHLHGNRTNLTKTTLKEWPKSVSQIQFGRPKEFFFAVFLIDEQGLQIFDFRSSFLASAGYGLKRRAPVYW